MNKKELVQEISKRTGLSVSNSEKALTGLTRVIQEELIKGGKIQIVGFGTYEVREHSQRTGRNPRTGETQIVPAKKVPAFKPGKSLKNLVNQ